MERVVVAGVGIHHSAGSRLITASWEQSPRERRSLTLGRIRRRGTHPGRQRRAEMAKGQNVMDLSGGAASDHQRGEWCGSSGSRCSSVPAHRERAHDIVLCLGSRRLPGFHCARLLAMADRGGSE